MVYPEIKSRSKLPVTAINELSTDIPLITGETYTHNDYYGHATVIKKFAGYPPKQQIKAAIEHGPYFSDYVWEKDLDAILPGILCFSTLRHTILTQATHKYIMPIGPIMAYADCSIDAEEMKREKLRLNRNLLFFPSHSTHWIDVDFDMERVCDRLDEIGKDFDSIRVCLYWKDILSGKDAIYRSRGYECVTAGHIYDPAFLDRLKTIISLSDLTVSNGIGTHIGYCIFMGKPHYLIKSTLQYTVASSKQNHDQARIAKNEADIYFNMLYDSFNHVRSDITPRQYDLIDSHWGLSEVKSRENLKGILDELEALYRSRPARRF